MITNLKLNFVFEPDLETFYLDLINALFNKRFQTLEQVDNFLDKFITEKILNEKVRGEQICKTSSKS